MSKDPACCVKEWPCSHNQKYATGCLECLKQYALKITSRDEGCSSCTAIVDQRRWYGEEIKYGYEIIRLTPEEIDRAVPCDTDQAISSILDEARKTFLSE